MRMVGVPEASIDYWIAKFLGQGYKVGRVDQEETALGADLRRKDDKEKNGGKGNGKGQSKSKGKSKDEGEDEGSGKSHDTSNKPKIVNRELKTVLTTGTIVDGHLLTDDLSNHCIAVKEFIEEAGSDPRFGIVIADCSTAEFTMSAFQDDTCRTKLETTIRQHRPRELIVEAGNLSVPTLRLLRTCVGPSCTWNNLQPGAEFKTAKEAIIGVQKIFSESGSETVPPTIARLFDNDEAMSAMGGMLWYLSKVGNDRVTWARLMPGYSSNSTGTFFRCKTSVSRHAHGAARGALRLILPSSDIFDPIRDGQSLVLDGQTLAHIEILQNSLGTDDGTLFKLLCRCSTPFGKRLFKIWVCQPLLQAKAINDRQAGPSKRLRIELTSKVPDSMPLMI